MDLVFITRVKKIERVYDVAVRYQQENVPLIIIAGEDYGCGSSRDWAAKELHY